MAYSCPKDLDGFMPLLGKADTRFRLQVGADLLAYLADPFNPEVCSDIGQFIDGLVPWMQSSNYKVSSNGIEILTYLIDRLGTDFRPFIQTVLPNVIDRLGDAKDTVREKAQLLILKLLERNVLTPQTLLEKLQPCFSHKNAKIREEVLRCLVNIVNEHGTHSLTLSKFIPDIVKLLSDPTASVRDTAFNTLVDLYKHVGDKLKADLQRRNLVPQTKWPVLVARFEEAKSNGELLPTATKSSNESLDEVDKVAMHKPIVPVKKPALASASKQRGPIGSANSAGAVDEEFFLKSFEDVPTVQIFNAREVAEQMKSIQEVISDTNKDWNKRVDALKKIRSLVIAGATNYEEFYAGLKSIDLHLQTSIKDLRSQVVREACITISYLSQVLGNKFDKVAEVLLQTLINLIQNSAKIMATSGIVTMRFIIQNTHSQRLIPIITSNLVNSKSKDIRRSCCEFIELMLTHWPTHVLEKHVAALQDAVKKGIQDADPEARVCARRAFRSFQSHFPDQAESLLQSLEPSYRRALQGDGMSASSSNNNLSSCFKTPRQYSRPMAPHSATDSGKKGFRSNSAIDLQAAQRAKARAQYSAMTRGKVHSGTASLPRPKKAADLGATASPERISRTRSRNSQSQPTSRSGSPSSRLAYLYNRSAEHDSPRPRRLSSGIPRSTTGSRDTSRETSPNRSLNRFRRSTDRPPISPASKPVLAQKILQQSREAENALADVLNDSGEGHYRSPKKSLRSLDNHSDDSETSSICSERSYDSFKRPSDSYSWSGSQQRLASRELWEPCRDINEIISLCASTNWQERKDGLLSLQYYLNNESRLTPGELKHLTEIFTKMFMDSHTKGLSVFLDTLHEVIQVHKGDLDYWLYVLLQRVFLKIGTDTLSSIQSKLMNTLELIRNSFPIKLLITNVYRFLIDATQTPNSRVKVVVLNFLTSLCNHREASQHISSGHAGQALQKIITYAQDSRLEISRAAKQCLVALWNCNTPMVTMMLTELPKESQEVASHIVHSHMRKSSTGSEPGSPMVLGSPKPLSPGTSPLGDGLNQEEIYRSLRRTTAEIQNYSYETLGSKLDRDRDTTSQDSGISQMSVGNDVKNDMAYLEEKMEDLGIRHTGVRSGSRSLPYTTVNGISETDSNGCKSLGDIKDVNAIVRNIVEKCVIDLPTPASEKRKLLAQLLDLIKQGQTQPLIENFKKILRILLDHLNPKDQDPQSQCLALQILAAIFKCPEMKECWSSFVELLTLRVLYAHCVEKREVVKEAEATVAAMAVCPFDTIVNTLAPLIQTSPYPEVLGAIKMLTKLIELNPKAVTDEHLQQIMPGILKGTDHTESPVRKSSIFCMVALYKAVGEERFSGYMNLLTGSKVKLLKLYISRSEHNSSAPTSPKNTSSCTILPS